MIAAIRTLTLLLLFVAFGQPSRLAWAAALPFVDGSYESIRKAHRGQPFALIFWSVECGPCVKELSVLAHALQQHPAMQLVLISTDEAVCRAKVDAMLAQEGLGGVESWMFGDGDSSRLRSQVDPRWYGELPRSYFYDAHHRRTALSGPITPEYLEAWLKKRRL